MPERRRPDDGSVAIETVVLVPLLMLLLLAAVGLGRLEYARMQVDDASAARPVPPRWPGRPMAPGLRPRPSWTGTSGPAGRRAGIGRCRWTSRGSGPAGW